MDFLLKSKSVIEAMTLLTQNMKNLLGKPESINQPMALSNSSMCKYCPNATVINLHIQSEYGKIQRQA